MKLGDKIKIDGEEYRLVYGQLDCKGCAFNRKGPRSVLCFFYGAKGSKSCVDQTHKNQPVFGKFKKIVRRK